MTYDNTAAAASARKAGGGGVHSICMKTHFSIDCPHCRMAQYLYGCGDNAGETRDKPGQFRKEAKSFYKAPLNYSFGLVKTSTPSKFDGTRLCMQYWPKSIVDEILVSVEDPNPDARWSNISNIPSARGVILRKMKKEGTDYAQYKASQAQQDWALDMAWFESMKQYMCDVYNPVALMAAAEAYQNAGSMFTCYGDMKIGESATIRVLPVQAYPTMNLFPIGVVTTHWSAAQSPWDAKWKEVGFNMARYDEVLADPAVAAFMAGVDRRINGAAPTQAPGAYTVGSPTDTSPVYQGMGDVPF